MLYIVLVVGLVLVFCFSFVLLFGAPYLPTKKTQVDQALDLLDLKKGQTLLELGAGTGSVCIGAAKRGIKVTAYELNPLVAAVLWFRTRRYRSMITVRMSNFWKADFGGYDGVYVFLLDSFMARLHKKMLQQANKGTRLASYTFKIPDIKIAKQNGPIYLYKY